MDPDFMKRGNADAPFAPSPEQPLLHWLCMALVLVGLVYAGYRAWEYWHHKPSPIGPAQAGLPPGKPLPSPQANIQTRPSEPSTAAPGTRIINKCIVNGKTMYGDDACPQGSASARVVTKADHNLMSGLTPAQMAAAERIAPEAPSVYAQAGGTVSDRIRECQALDERIKYLDAMARQPQSGQMQDWISNERKIARDRQFRIPCR
jgi:hypothetical protein